MKPLPPLHADHVLIGTPDYSATLAWYRAVLDARIDLEWTVPELPGMALAYLRVGDFKIEVIGTADSIPGALRAEDFGSHLRTSGYTHLCFAVANVDETMAALAEHGVPEFFPATDFPNVGRRVAFIQDNNGNVIEFAGPMNAN
jgi:catechol 2,3-dioxygenase-like lactoylglutathione lyase family enzyme